MLTNIGVCICIIMFLASCSNRAAGAHINNNGRGGGFMQGEVLKF